VEFLLLLFLLGGAKGKAPTAGQETTIKARDGSSHRLRFVVAKNRATGATSSGWIALSTDTGIRFKEGEQASILGRSYRWHAAGPLVREQGSAFSGGAFI